MERSILIIAHVNSHLSDGMPRQDCESGAAKGKQERGAAQVDALVVAMIIMIIMYDTCDRNISGNELYGDAGWNCPRGLTNLRNYVFICDFLGQERQDKKF